MGRFFQERMIILCLIQTAVKIGHKGSHKKRLNCFFFYSVLFFAQCSKILEKLYIGKVAIQTLVLPLIIIQQSLIALFADFWNTVLSIQYIPFWVSNMSHILSQYKHLILKTPLALWLLGIQERIIFRPNNTTFQWHSGRFRVIFFAIQCRINDNKERYYNLSFVKSNIIKWKLDINEIF